MGITLDDIKGVLKTEVPAIVDSRLKAAGVIKKGDDEPVTRGELASLVAEAVKSALPASPTKGDGKDVSGKDAAPVFKGDALNEDDIKAFRREREIWEATKSVDLSDPDAVESMHKSLSEIDAKYPKPVKKAKDPSNQDLSTPVDDKTSMDAFIAGAVKAADGEPL